MNQEEKYTDLIELTIKKLTGEASKTELEQLEIALRDSDENEGVYKKFVRTWEESGKAKGITSEETEAEWQRLNSVIKEGSKKNSSFSLYKVAATVALIILGSITTYFFVQNSETTIVATDIQTKSLKDGSQVTLNANSKLTFSKDFNRKNRKVKLDGEAYFEVKSDKSKPFIIAAHGLDVTVVGTSFNVKSNENSDASEVVVNTGTVKLTYASKSILLTAGEKGRLLRASGKLFKMQNDNPNYQAWKTKKFEFKDTPLIEVVNLLNEVYDKSLYIEKKQLESCPITASFNNQSFESILKILENTLDLIFKETGSGILVTGDNC